ncbi:hemolysin family protein [Clostridium folliculivorans]|uniref:Hemolysin n=1 Tax=Clostridium folliculivorans TaxID=2886038 RepID=A0A9W6DBE3_9CLOT|nr:hemolysin family protein [Clostridium folliculivorans]GKU26340.1 hypothetical protein CFOLD11_31670 [Clostridium folliculivorans]GKU32105.1 hypothetical protein CFB3_42130 [Clostridium folliculivorans]
MDPSPYGSILFQLLLIVFLTLINAFFSSAEMAIISLNKNKVRNLAEKGNKKAVSLIKLLDEPSNFLATIQVGITLASFFASASAATGISGEFSVFLGKFNIPYSSQISLVVITILLSYFTLVFGELFPKRVALQNSEAIAMFSVMPIVFVSKISSPFVKFLSGSTNLLLRLVGIDGKNLEEKVSKEEIKSLVQVGQEHGVINETEKEMIESIIEFDDKLAKEVMTPRTEVFLLNINTPIREISSKLLNENFSRVPVYEGHIDNIIGILYMKDFFFQANKTGIDKINIRSILRTPYFVPETNNIDTLFKELQDSKNHMAILIDEYGGFSGVVSIEDLIEEVMGNIFDEYDENDNESEIKKLDNNTYLIDGLLSINDVNEHLHLDIETDNFDTIGGFLVSMIGKIPKSDEEKIVEYKNVMFKVEEVGDKRIKKIKACMTR